MMASLAAYTVLSSFRTLSAAIEEMNVKHATDLLFLFLNRKFEHASTLGKTPELVEKMERSVIEKWLKAFS